MENLETYLQDIDVNKYLDYATNLLAALAIFIIGKWITGWIVKLIRVAMEKRKTDPVLVSFISSLAQGALLALVVITALGTLGVQTTSFAALIAAAGLAIGLALQGSLSNFASGVLIILFRPFKVGDFIDAGGTMGIVEEVGILFTILKTPDNKKIIAPNTALMGGVITNFSANPTRRVDMTFGVSYSDDLDKVEQTIKSVILGDARILEDPAPQVAVISHGDNSINFVCRPWVKKEDYWDVLFDTHKKIKQRFDEEGISIPFPQRDIHIVEDKTKSS